MSAERHDVPAVVGTTATAKRAAVIDLMSVLKRAGVKCPGSRLDDCTRDCRHLGIEVAFGVAQHACRAGHDRRCLRSRGAPIPGILCRADPQQKPIAVEALPVVGTAMAQAGVVGIGRLTLSRRERMVMVEPRGTGMALFALRAADEVRTPQFGRMQETGAPARYIES